jgi:hypothetical protein
MIDQNSSIRKRLAIFLTGVAVGSFALISACNDAGFSGDAPKKAKPPTPAKPSPAADTDLVVPCIDGKGKLVKKLSGIDDPVVSLEGEFCNSASLAGNEGVSILFVVDGSGSMMQSDPLKGGSCGRLKAAQAIMNQVTSASSEGVAVGLHFFGDLSKNVVELTTPSVFSNSLNAETLCQTELGGTNYQSALTLAREALQNVKGRKVVYFLTDGAPTLSGTNPGNLSRLPNQGFSRAQQERQLRPIYDAGKKAAEDLRAMSETDLFALYLSEPGSGSDLGVIVEEPESYLKTIAGGADKFRLAESADELAAKIVEFTPTTPLMLKTSSLKAVLNAEGFAPKTVKISSLTQKDSSGVWKFVSEPFTLYTSPGKAVLNTVTVQVESSEGQVLETIAKIEYLKEN